MEWWPVVVHWNIMFEAWKYRNSLLVPNATERPIAKTILQILVNFEAFRALAQENSEELIMLVREKELEIKWSAQRMKPPGSTLTEQREYFLALSKNYFPMMVLPEMQKQLYTKMHNFRQQVQAYKDAKERQEEEIWTHKKQLQKSHIASTKIMKEILRSYQQQQKKHKKGNMYNKPNDQAGCSQGLQSQESHTNDWQWT